MYSTLHVTVVSARKLYDAAWLDTQDPYVKLSVKGAMKRSGLKKQKKTTKVDRNAHRTPKWNQTFNFAIPAGQETGTSLKIKVMDRNHVTEDSEIGFNSLNIATTIDGVVRDKWYPLYRRSKLTGSKKSAGEIHLRIHLTRGMQNAATTMYTNTPLQSVGRNVFAHAYGQQQPVAIQTTAYVAAAAAPMTYAAAPPMGYAAAAPSYPPQPQMGYASATAYPSTAYPAPAAVPASAYPSYSTAYPGAPAAAAPAYPYR